VAATDPRVVSQTQGDKKHAMRSKVFLVRLSAGKKYRITLDSSDFDSFLFVEDQARQQRAWDDDSGGGLNSLLTYDVAKDGVYMVFAASYDDRVGQFTLRVREAVSVAVHDVGKEGLTLQDTVAPTDAQLVAMKKGKEVRQLPAREFRVRLSAGKKYLIAMTSKDFDSYLSVRAPSGHAVAWDDDSGDEDDDALVELEVFKEGVYNVQAASYRGAGRFTLKVTEIGAAHVHDVGTGLQFTRSLEKVDTVTVCVRLQAGQAYVIDMCSKDLKKVEPWLHVLAEDGKLLAEDRGGGEGGNARVRFKAWETGIYRVVADAFALEGGCEFVLAIRPDTGAESWRDGGSWSVTDGELRQTDRGAMHWLFFGDVTWTDYDFEVETQLSAGAEIDIGVRVASPANLVYVALGGFTNTHHGLIRKQEAGASTLDTLAWVDGKTQPDGRYRVRVEARGNDVKVFLDGKLMLKAAGQGGFPRGCVGVGTLHSSARFRNPRITTPEGRILMDRWPADLPRMKPAPGAGKKFP
jgi:hypothetical protein